MALGSENKEVMRVAWSRESSGAELARKTHRAVEGHRRLGSHLGYECGPEGEGIVAQSSSRKLTDD